MKRFMCILAGLVLALVSVFSAGAEELATPTDLEEELPVVQEITVRAEGDFAETAEGVEITVFPETESVEFSWEACAESYTAEICPVSEEEEVPPVFTACVTESCLAVPVSELPEREYLLSVSACAERTVWEGSLCFRIVYMMEETVFSAEPEEVVSEVPDAEMAEESVEELPAEETPAAEMEESPEESPAEESSAAETEEAEETESETETEAEDSDSEEETAEEKAPVKKAGTKKTAARKAAVKKQAKPAGTAKRAASASASPAELDPFTRELLLYFVFAFCCVSWLEVL